MPRINAKQCWIYTCSDGKEFLSESEALRHEARAGLYAFLEHNCVGRGGMWDTEMIRDFMLDNRQALIKLLEPEVYNA